MHRRVRLRSDGLLEISPASWRDSLTIRHPGILGGLLVASVVCISMLIACVVHVALVARHRTSASILGAMALVGLALWRAGWYPALLRRLRSA